ncbi:conserved Plasmodium protein, unknown function [Plasmodium gallinaceum]|uniref:KELT protein n=1 Tax=Plasmodium gallinaceum TaxID=5849 RepID=A0A1J1GPX3_PLAGA|nr:conserved Plasmodium protein, unknown function [Plasmodium gallinaceum]CRG94557.1 conserved Plasmodium protein, unknown function [Plasmodium gallinaceum]
MNYFYRISILLFYFHAQSHINKCIKKISLSEEFAKHALKSNSTDDIHDNESTTEVVEDTDHSSESPKSEELKEMGAVGGCEKESTDEIESNQVENTFKKKNNIRKNKKRSKKRVENKQKEDEIPSRKLIKDVLRLQKIPQENSLSVNKEELKEFEVVITALNKVNENLNNSFIEKFLAFGIRKEHAKGLNEEFPIYLGSKINFTNMEKPFGTEFKNLNAANKLELNDTLFFDNFMSINLYKFLNETYVGNLPLEKVPIMYYMKNINYLPYNIQILSFLNSKCTLQNILSKIPTLITLYLESDNPEICDFNERDSSLIHKENVRIINFLERLRANKRFRYFTEDEYAKLNRIISYAERNINLMQRITIGYNVKIDVINDGISNFLNKISLDDKLLSRDNIIISCIFYILSYCIEFAKPLYEKILKRKRYTYEELFFISSNLNMYINILEFLEHNSKLCNDFHNHFRDLEAYYPRVKSGETLLFFYNYIMIKINIMSIIYNINKLFLRITFCERMVEKYKKHNYSEYGDIMNELQYILNTSVHLIT